jgi:PAS domain S-box-containing protein
VSTEHDDKALNKEVDTLEAVLNGLTVGVVVVDPEGKLLLFNPEAERILGMGARMVGPEEWAAAYGCYLPDQITPYPTDQLPLIRAMRGEEVNNQVVFVRNSRQQQGAWISVTGRPLRGGAQSIRGRMIVLRDIAHRELTEELLHSPSSNLSTLIETHQAGVLVENEQRRIVSVNQTFCTLFNIATKLSELMGASGAEVAEQCRNLFRDPQGFIRRVQQLLDAQSLVTNEHLYLTDGRVFERDYIPVFVDERCRGHVWQYRDTTARYRAYRRIKNLERLSTAVEQTADSVVIADKHGVIEYVNPAFEAITGYSRDEVIGKTPGILKSGYHDGDFYRKLWTEVLAGRPFRGTIVNRKKTGELYWSQQTITPMKNDVGNITHFVSVLKDITELLKQKEQEGKLRLAREVQQRFYRARASVPGFDIAGAAYPADETGGDYFDFISMPDGCVGIAIGDVSGHGISAALVMAATRAYLRSFATSDTDVACILDAVNRALSNDLPRGQYVTLMLCRLDPKKRVLTFAGGGHVPGYLLDRHGHVERTIGSTGPPLGLFPDSTYSSGETLMLEPGQIVLLLTDGMTDSISTEQTQSGIEQTLTYVGAHGHEPARQIVEGLYHASRAWVADKPQEDDATSVVLKVI